MDLVDIRKMQTTNNTKLFSSSGLGGRLTSGADLNLF